MQVVFSELQFGDAEQKIFLVTDKGMTYMTSAPLDQLGETIAGVANANKIDKVILRGVHDYATKIMGVLVNKGLTVEIK